MVVAVVLAETLACCGSSGKKHSEARVSNCAQVLRVEWDGQTRSLSSCAGKLGLAPPNTPDIQVHVGEDVELVAPKGAESIFTNAQSSDPAVFSPLSPGAALARFKAVRQGSAEVSGQSTDCLSSPNRNLAECVVLRISVV
jgi:hypothetical protein